MTDRGMTRRRGIAHAFAALVGAGWLLAALASPGAAASACSGGAAGLLKAAQFDDTLHLGRTPLSLVTAGIQNRVDGYAVDDLIPQFAGFAPEKGIAGFVPGTTGHLAGSGDLLLTGVQAELYAWNGSGPPKGSAVPVTAAVSGGLVTVAYPSKPGLYVLDFYVRWETECLRGDGGATVAIDSSLPATDTASELGHRGPFPPAAPAWPALLSAGAGLLGGLLVYARLKRARPSG